MQIVGRWAVAAGALTLMSAEVHANPVSLHDAIELGDPDAVPRILSAGAEIDAVGPEGEPPLVSAALRGQTDIVRLLVEAGADPFARTDRGLTALHAAAFAGHHEIAAILIANDTVLNDNANRFGIAPLHAAAEENNAEIVALFLNAGADVELTERNGYSPATRAGWREHWEIVRMLKTAGAECQPEALVGDWLYRHCTELPE